MDFITTTDASKKWGISSRRITTLCNEGRVEGAELIGRTWFIPRDTKKPCTQKRGPKSDTNDNESTF
ncbi:MAG: DNA-binding protein [Lachnospiraceae bacterium]|nr:DNA-binding protein [Lachnospiraceae bacterium]